MGKRYYITTPIYYINDKPHIWHLYTTFAADLLARFYRFVWKEVKLLTWTDENSQKTVEAAKEYFEKEDISIEEVKKYTDELAWIWKETWGKIGASIDDFIRTTEERHKDAVKKLFKKLDSKWYIYKWKYIGLYCWKCENFYKKEELIKWNKWELLCPDHKIEVDSLEEENYFFSLSTFTQDIIDFFDKNPLFLHPSYRIQELKNNFLNEWLEDISISREGKEWWISLPYDKDHVFYVWFDALINYISAIWYGNDEKMFDKWWNNSRVFHFLGKDIMKFHSLLWPAFLLGWEENLPDKEVINWFFTIDWEKISKSLWNAVEPISLVEKYWIDAVKYYLFVDLKLWSDGDFSFDRLDSLYNNNLLSGWWNLVSRVTKLAYKNNLTKVDLTSEDIKSLYWIAKELDVEKNDFLNMFFDGFDKKLLEKYFANLDFTSYIQQWYQLVQIGNKFLETNKPRERLKNNYTEWIKDLEIGLYLVKNIALISAPLLIDSFEKIKDILGINVLRKINTQETNIVDLNQVFEMTKFEVNISPDFLYKKV